MGHVNMMADLVLVHATPEDLRAILRNMLSSKTPGLTAAFITSTRARLHQRSGYATANVLKQPFSDAGDAPAPQLLASLTHARMLYGSGLGFASLQPLAAVVRSTIGHHWEPEGEVAHALTFADSDVAAALQSCKDELQGGTVDYTMARAALNELAEVLEASRRDVDGWGGEFPFERAIFSVQDFKL
ncbi:hypothetical protein K438DRAFT_1725618 [Mycena galopus ATCC 62051]|nr:hypothetical protein K438DRAFT_1725618 [Mycena galopus ATCC 62051]